MPPTISIQRSLDVNRLRSGIYGLAFFMCLVVWFAAAEPSAAQKDTPPKDTPPVKDVAKDAPPKDGPTPKGTLPKNWKGLGLTSDQIKMVYKVEDVYRTKIETLKQQIDDLRKEEKGELEKILTPAQKDRLKEIILGELNKDKTPPKDALPKDTPVKDTPSKDTAPKDAGTDKK
jgi:hypothetical protein